MIKDTVVIMFHGGTYGKYLYWILNNFTTRGLKTDVELFPDRIGSSHNQTINGVKDPPYTICDQRNWEEHARGKNNLPYYAHHLVEGSDGILDDDAWQVKAGIETNIIASTVKKSILIQNGPEHNLQALNDTFEKTFSNPLDYFNLINRFDDFKVDVNDISAVRELLSYKLFYLKYRTPCTNLQPNILPVELFDLLLNFEQTMNKIVNFLGVHLTVPIMELISYHNENMKLQKHLHKDEEISKFLMKFKCKIPYSVPENCSVIDEAYIQKYLRDELQLEIKCTGLEVFPETSSELRRITYPAKEMKNE